MLCKKQLNRTKFIKVENFFNDDLCLQKIRIT